MARNGSLSMPTNTSFGIVRHRMAQVRDMAGAIFCPLEKQLRILPYLQYQGEELEAPVGQAIHLSYRLAVQETRRLKGQGPSKSTLWRRLQDLGEARVRQSKAYSEPFSELIRL
jgi:hypothetical protein